jgi:tRNA nucleotidyltransferase (CCA-adding enzyme)
LERVSATQYMEEGRPADVPGIEMPDLIPHNEDLVHVLDVLCAGGYGAWVVGGSVRDCILGKIPTDYDICTDATPKQVIESFDETIPTGERFGTITVKSGKSMFEVTTLRVESDYGDGRRPDAVEWGNSLSVDLSRRDFTMNSMAYDYARGLLHDPYNGKVDLDSGKLRAVGEAKQRLSEDGLRIMRAYRFMDRQEKGIWYPDNELSSALIDNRAMLGLVSIERVWSELERIIVGKNAHIVLSRMNDDGVLSAIFGYPFAKDIFDFIRKLPEDLEARAAMLFTYLKGSEVSTILNRFKCSNKIIGRTKLLHFLLHNTPEKNDLRIYRNQLGAEVNTHICLMDAIGADTSNLVKSLDYPTDIVCLIDGVWLMTKTGLGPGIKLGRLKDWLFRIQIERGYTDLSQLETALCTVSWTYGDPKEWPRPKWP